MQTILLKTCLLIPGQRGGEIAYTPETSTIGGLLRHLGRRIDFELVDRDGAVFKELEVSINGKPLCFYPSGLDTALAAEDRVAIYFVALGGG